MKKIITLLCCVLYSYGSFAWASSSFTIQVPQALLEQKASLVVYMVDSDGNQCIGKCQLDHTSRKISQDELELTTCEEANRFDMVIDLMSEQVGSQDVVILHFEFDSSVQILKILVVKDSLLEEDPFTVLTLSLKNNDFEAMHHSFAEFEQDDVEFDELSALVQDVDSAAMDSSIAKQKRKTSRLEQYMLYAEIYMLMQYGRVKRAMRGMKSWLIY